MKHILSLTALLVIFGTIVTPVAHAADFTTYSCLAPQGTMIVSYDEGVHGIIGSTAAHEGSDVVYRTGDNYLQCYCNDNGDGIQTNWINARDLSSEQISAYRRDGWIYAETGSSWGLTNDPYLAKNASYICRGRGGATEGESDSAGYGTGGGELLAATGSWSSIGYLILMGTTFISGAYLLARPQNT